MGRVKREIKLIEVEKSRLLTFQKRRRGLTKKISELATLCGISACMICFGPDGSLFSGPFLWPDSQSLNIICSKYLGIDKAEREKRMLRISNFHATKDEEEEENQEIASCSNSSSRNSKSVSCDGGSASGGDDGGSRAMRELVEELEASSSVELLQQVVRKLDSRLAMVKERIRLLKVESLDLNLPLCGPSEEFEMWEGDFQEIDGNRENTAAVAQESSNQQQISIPVPMVLEETSTNSNSVAADAAGLMHSKRGLSFRRSSGLHLLPSVLPPITALLPIDQEPSSPSSR